MNSFLLHQFSPQRTDPAILKETLVSRNALLDEVLDKIRASTATSAQHHFLLIGPRGIGKTNFLTLIHHELSQDTASIRNLRIAWLNEDELSATFLLLLRRIYRALSGAYPSEYPLSVIESLTGKTQDVALDLLTRALVDASSGRKVLVMVENVDEHFSKMKVAEQMRWRAFLQNHKEFITLGTAQKLTAEVSKRRKPFFNFFDVRTLKPLSVEESKDLLIRIARLRKGEHDAQLIEFLETPRGLGRLRAIHSLAGGNPRLYVLLSELLTAKDLDDVVNAFEEMVDRQLTSYYQERLRWVSGQQQEIIHELCRARAPISVKKIAEGIFATNQTVSRQLKDLSGMGYVQSHSVGRESVYELSEPLMRLVLEAKQGSGRGRLRLIVEFLRLWFEPEELRQKLELCQSDVSKSYLEEALGGGETLAPEIEWNHVPDDVPELMTRLNATEDPGLRLQIVREMLSNDGLPQSLLAFLLTASAAERLRVDDFKGALEDTERVLEINEVPSFVRPNLHLVRSAAFIGCEEFKRAIPEISESIRFAAPSQVPFLRIQRAHIHLILGDEVAAIQELEDVLQSPDLSTELQTTALLSLGRAQKNLEHWLEAVSAWDALLEFDNIADAQRGKVTLDRAKALVKLGDGNALDGFSLAIERAANPEQRAAALLARARLAREKGDSDSAIRDLGAAIDLPDLPNEERARILLDRASLYSFNDQHDLALADANEAVQCSNSDTSRALSAYHIRGLLHEIGNRSEEALADYDAGVACQVPGLALRSLSLQRAALLSKLNRNPEAAAELRRVLERYEGGAFSSYKTEYRLILGLLFTEEFTGAAELVHKLVLIAATAGELGELGTALVHQLKALRSAGIPPAALEEWARVWAKAGADREDLVVPLRLFEIGLKYLADPQDKILLALPLEERQLLREALGLD